MRYVTCATLLILTFTTSEISAQITVQRTVISSEAARKMGEACEMLAKEKGWHVTVWVIGEAGQSLYMYRMQGAPWLSVEPSRMKAQTALQTGRSSGSYEDAAKARGVIKGSTMAVELHNFMAAGGLPVVVNGQIAGAIGVGGSPDDEGCARAGIDAGDYEVADMRAVELLPRTVGPPAFAVSA